MRPDLTPLPLDQSGNGSRMRTLTYDEADAPMLMHAMSLGAATSMMSQGDASVRRFKHYQSELAQVANPASEFMNRDTDLCEIAIIATAVPTWSIHRHKQNGWSDSFRGVVTIGTRTFDTKWTIDEAAFQAIAAMLVEILPMTCERIETDDVLERKW